MPSNTSTYRGGNSYSLLYKLVVLRQRPSLMSCTVTTWRTYCERISRLILSWFISKWIVPVNKACNQYPMIACCDLQHTPTTAYTSGIILGMGLGSASERRRFIVTSSPIGRAHTKNDPCTLLSNLPISYSQNKVVISLPTAPVQHPLRMWAKIACI